MKLRQGYAFAFFIFMLMIWAISCDDSSDTNDIKWTCSCSSAHLVSQIALIQYNCSETCNCETATGRSSDYKWICTCVGGELPLLVSDNKKTDCFTDCNCTSGSLPRETNPRKYVSSQVVSIVLSICLVFFLAFSVSMICFILQRKKLQSTAFLSEEGSSYSSGVNLIGRKPFLLHKSGLSVCFSRNSITGCIDKFSLLFKSKAEGIHGTITPFSYSELEHATNKFSDSNLIGLGASSHVYRGQLKDSRTIAVKRLKIPENYDADSVFLTEIELLSRLHHCHVVPLIGYCSESVGKQAERLLVFNFMANGNLRECLDGASGRFLDWNTRVAIALGAARGLEYLHEAAAPKILHRDVKSTNILLDENWIPKITDLGMAKHIRTDGFSSCSSSPARMQGTFGYIAPEYAIVGKASLKSDVFSYGVVLLELITGRKPVYSWPGKGEESLVIWAAPRLHNGRCVIAELPDPHLKGKFPEEEMHMMAYLAKECLLLDPENRPSMSTVVQILLTISPDPSTRRKFTVNLFQNLPKDKLQLDEKSLPLEYTQTCSMQKGNLPSDYPTEPIHLASKGKSCCCAHQDEESVDLTEPRYESFCMENCPSHVDA